MYTDVSIHVFFLFIYFSSKPTGGVGGPQADSGTTNGSAAASAVDWMCLVCGCVNFARRTSCFQVMLVLIMTVSFWLI